MCYKSLVFTDLAYDVYNIGYPAVTFYVRITILSSAILHHVGPIGLQKSHNAMNFDKKCRSFPAID